MQARGVYDGRCVHGRTYGGTSTCDIDVHNTAGEPAIPAAATLCDA